MIVIVYSSSERSVRGTSIPAIQISGRAGGAGRPQYRPARPAPAPRPAHRHGSARHRRAAPPARLRPPAARARLAAPRRCRSDPRAAPGQRAVRARRLGNRVRAKGDQADRPVVLRGQRIGARAQRGLARVAQAIGLIEQQHQRPRRRRRAAEQRIGQRQHDQRGGLRRNASADAADPAAPQPPRQRQRRQQDQEEQKLWIAKDHRWI